MLVFVQTGSQKIPISRAKTKYRVTPGSTEWLEKVKKTKSWKPEIKKNGVQLGSANTYNKC